MGAYDGGGGKIVPQPYYILKLVANPTAIRTSVQRMNGETKGFRNNLMDILDRNYQLITKPCTTASRSQRHFRKPRSHAWARIIDMRAFLACRDPQGWKIRCIMFRKLKIVAVPCNHICAPTYLFLSSKRKPHMLSFFFGVRLIVTIASHTE